MKTKTPMQELISKWDEIVSNTHGVGGKPQEFYNKEFMQWFRQNMDRLKAKEREQKKEVAIDFYIWCITRPFDTSEQMTITEAYKSFAREKGL